MNNRSFGHLKRLLFLLPSLLLVSFFTFTLLRMLPGGPIQMKMQFQNIPNSHGLVSSIKKLEAELELDKSVPDQYFSWMRHLALGDWGKSLVTGTGVRQIISEKLFITMSLGVLSIGMALSFSFALASIETLLKTRSSRLQTKGSLILNQAILTLQCTPPVALIFLLLMILMNVLNVDVSLSAHAIFKNESESLILNYFYLVKHLWLPAFLLSLVVFPQLYFILTNSLSREIKQEYISTAFAKGQSRWGVIIHHAFKNALFPFVAYLPYLVVVVLSGSLLIENIFNLDGMGYLAYRSFLSRDYPVLVILILLQSAGYLFCRILVDTVLPALDKRVR